MKRTNIPVAILMLVLVIITKADLSLSDAARTVSLCEIALNPRTYHNEILTIRANLYSYAGGVMHVNGIGCGPRSDAWATLEFDTSLFQTGTARRFLESIGDVTDQGEYKKVEVRSTGRVEDLGRDCYGPRLVLYATKIEPLSEIRTGRIGDGLK